MARLVNQVVIHTIRARGFVCFVLVVFMINLDLCLSASVNVRYILHTQPLGLYNTNLVWESLYPSLFVSILAGLSFSNTF
jgi:hypothetical protein